MTYSNRGNDRFRSTERPTMHDATCAKCGVACQVPFMPNGRREVFCSKCFEEINGGSRDSGSRSSYGGSRAPRMYDKRDSGSSNFADRQMFSAVCDQCGSSCQVPFRPTSGKPVLCSNCFAGKTESGRSSRGDGSNLEVINSKLDKIIKLLTPKDEMIAKNVITEKILEEIVKKPKKTTKKKE